VTRDKRPEKKAKGKNMESGARIWIAPRLREDKLGRDQQVSHPTVEQVNRRIGEQVKKENPKGDSGRLVVTSRLRSGLEWVF
jgi:hypothetical protein